MFSRILIKLIDLAIIPGLILIAAKVLSVVLVVNHFQIPLEQESNYLMLYFADRGNYITVNSYSNMAMVVVVSLFGLFFLIKSRILHDTHVTPITAAKLASLRLGSLIKTSFDLYTEGAIWLAYSFLLTLILGVEYYYGLVYLVVFLTSLLVSFLMTLILIMDVEQELG